MTEAAFDEVMTAAGRAGDPVRGLCARLEASTQRGDDQFKDLSPDQIADLVDAVLHASRQLIDEVPAIHSESCYAPELRRHGRWNATTDQHIATTYSLARQLRSNATFDHYMLTHRSLCQLRDHFDAILAVRTEKPRGNPRDEVPPIKSTTEN